MGVLYGESADCDPRREYEDTASSLALLDPVPMPMRAELTADAGG